MLKACSKMKKKYQKLIITKIITKKIKNKNTHNNNASGSKGCLFGSFVLPPLEDSLSKCATDDEICVQFGNVLPNFRTL